LQSFFNAIKRLAHANYLPTNQDILYSRVKTTGITETSFSMDWMSYSILDLSDTRSEQKKWIHCFEGVDAILFVVDIAAYDKLLYEDETVNGMHEQLTLFDSICNSRWFSKTPIVLLFHKVDVLRNKLETAPIEKYFSDYSGGKDFDAAKSYFSNRFLKLNQRDGNSISVYFTDIEDETRFAEVAHDSTRLPHLSQIRLDKMLASVVNDIVRGFTRQQEYTLTERL
jgi:guanine nucleotide-binding protein G(i) subunit alpha